MAEPDKLPKLSKEERATLRTGREAKAFLDSTFGKGYLAVLDEYLRMKRAEFENPLDDIKGIDGVAYALRAESAKGAIIGLRMASEVIRGMVSAAENLRVQKGLKEDDDDNE